MQQFTEKKFLTILKENGFVYIRTKGSHSIYKNEDGIHLSVPKKLKSVVALRLIKEHNLKYGGN